MKKTLIYILLLISYSACSQGYKIECDFKTEKTYKFTVKRAKIDSREPMTKDLAQLTEIEASFTQEDYRLICVWKYGETKAVGPEQLISQIEPEHIEMFNLYRGFEIEISFDPYFGGIELLNYEQMKENIKNGFLKVYNNQMTEIDSATMILIDEQIEPTYSTPEILLTTYFPEIELYFNVYSLYFSEEISMKSEYSYPNPYGGDPFPVHGEISVESKEGNILILKNEETADQEEVNRILKEMVVKMSKLGDSPINEEEIPDFTLNAKSRYFYDIELKLINKVMLEKIVEVSGFTQTEIIEVNLIE
jgi:hypothetical protein